MKNKPVEAVKQTETRPIDKPMFDALIKVCVTIKAPKNDKKIG